jgi:hypothetical protein
MKDYIFISIIIFAIITIYCLFIFLYGEHASCKRNLDYQYPLFNKRISTTPWKIVAPTQSSEITSCIQLATQHNKSITVLNGGHNYEGYSAWNDCLVIDVRNFNSVWEGKSNVTIGAAVNNCKVWNYAGLNKMFIGTGSSPTVSVTGSILCGGLTSNHRLHGLACDNVNYYNIVTPIGEKKIFPGDELFWALSGSGPGNFGVVTKVNINTYPAPCGACSYELKWTDSSKFYDVITLYTEWIQTRSCSPEITPYLSLYNEHISIVGIFVGSENKCRKILDLPHQFPRPNYVKVVHHNSQEDAEHGAWGVSETHNSGQSWYIQSCVIPKEIKPQTLRSICSKMLELKKSDFRTNLEWVPLGGNLIQNDKTSFRFYDCAAIVQVITKWDKPGRLKAAEEFTNIIYNLLNNELGKDTYLGFPSSQLTATDYYGTSKHLTRLKKIKKCIDPNNLFCSPQSIPIN